MVEIEKTGVLLHAKRITLSEKMRLERILQQSYLLILIDTTFFLQCFSSLSIQNLIIFLVTG